MVAKIKILVPGKLPPEDNNSLGYSTTILIIDGKNKIIVDPGSVPDPKIILNSLKKESLNVNDINYVALTHSHLDHFKFLGLFPKASSIDYWGIWKQNGLKFFDWKKMRSFHFSKNINIVYTPGMIIAV